MVYVFNIPGVEQKLCMSKTPFNKIFKAKDKSADFMTGAKTMTYEGLRKEDKGNEENEESEEDEEKSKKKSMESKKKSKESKKKQKKTVIAVTPRWGVTRKMRETIIGTRNMKKTIARMETRTTKILRPA